jgi:F-type H+-transporting ATPase subunit b
MLIDWFTVSAQLVNFLVLVWLLKRFLYRPILQAIDAREKRVAQVLSDAEAKNAEAQSERDTFQTKNDAFDKQRAELMSQATEEAKAERQRLLDEARQAADALAAQRMEGLRNDAQTLGHALTLRTKQEVFAIARKALADLSGTTLEQCLAEVFTRRLRELDEGAKELLAEALSSASAPALVRSAFELPAEPRAAIQQALNETFSADIPLRFETAPELIGGIELTTNGRKVAWSIADYLSALEKSVGELLQQPTAAESKSDATTGQDQ